MKNSIDKLIELMECKCGKRFSYEALFSIKEINFCDKCGRKKPKYLNEEFASKLISSKTDNVINEMELIVAERKRQQDYIEKLRKELKDI